MNKQDIQTVLDALKTSAHYLIGYSEHREAAITICEAALAEPEGEPSTVLRLIDTIKYLVGIAERGEGRKARDDELPEQFVLGYVKRLEAALAEPSEAVAWRHKVLGRIETAEAFAKPYNWGDRSEWEPLFTHPANNHLDEIAKVLHYPDCWDTAAYPTLEDAIIEAKSWAHCTNEDCHCPTKEA